MPQFDLYCFATVALNVLGGFFLLLLVFSLTFIPELYRILKLRAKLKAKMETVKANQQKLEQSKSTRTKILLLLPTMWK
jgi:hypothetical protein